MSNRGWHIEAIKADKAWEILTDPETGEIDYGDVRIGHVDTGYTPHEVFGSWSTGETNLITDQWTNMIETDSPDPLDHMDYKGFRGHGTRIGSVISGDEPGTMRGVAPGCPMVPYRATNSVILARAVNRHVENIGKAIRHAVEQTDCNVISMSLGTPTFPKKNMGKAVDIAYANGVIVVAASGNNKTDHVTYPAKYSKTICAGGVQPDGTIWREHAEFMRKHIDILAPADQIYRANARRENNSIKTFYEDKLGNGTSYAAACTAGAAALWLAHRGDEIDDKYDEKWMTVEAFRKLLVATAQPLAQTRPGIETGILDIEALLLADLPDIQASDEVQISAAKERH